MNDDVNGLLRHIMAASNDVEVSPYIKEIVGALGAQWYVFVSLHPSDHTAERGTHRFLIGCRPEWCQIYNARKWYLIDPCIEYSRTNTAPMLGSEIPLRTRGQRELLACAAEHGFKSGFIVPVHGSEHGRIGVLYAGSEEDPEVAEGMFKSNRAIYRALALELLDWSTNRLRLEVLNAYNISERDVKLVRYVWNGFNASDIARELSLSVATIYSYFQKINAKLGVNHIAAAVKFAEQNGLLP